jgi:hypothetical protein
LFALSLQVRQLISPLLQGTLQVLHPAAQVLILLQGETFNLYAVSASNNFKFNICGYCIGTSVSFGTASHLDEYRAGLGGDDRELLQEALGDSQTLFQTLVLR